MSHRGPSLRGSVARRLSEIEGLVISQETEVAKMNLQSLATATTPRRSHPDHRKSQWNLQKNSRRRFLIRWHSSGNQSVHLTLVRACLMRSWGVRRSGRMTEQVRHVLRAQESLDTGRRTPHRTTDPRRSTTRVEARACRGLVGPID